MRLAFLNGMNLENKILEQTATVPRSLGGFAQLPGLLLLSISVRCPHVHSPALALKLPAYRQLLTGNRDPVLSEAPSLLHGCRVGRGTLSNFQAEQYLGHGRLTCGAEWWPAM